MPIAANVPPSNVHHWDRVVWDEVKAARIGSPGLTGYGHYRERYRRCEDGAWRIATTTLTRLHIDFDPKAGS
jgi:hypothetical protein